MLNSIHAEISTGEPLNSQSREAVYATAAYQFLAKSMVTYHDRCSMMAVDPDICAGSALSGAKICHRDMIGTSYNVLKSDHGSKINGQTAATSRPAFCAGFGVHVPFVHRRALEGRFGSPRNTGARSEVCSRGTDSADLARSPLIGDILPGYMAPSRNNTI